MRILTVMLLVVFGSLILVLDAQGLSQRILFSRAGPGEPGEIGVFVANADGTGEQPLAPAASLNYNPAWFPDGQAIVFTSERDGSADLYKVNLDGSNLTRLTNDAAYDDQAALAPDGQRIVFVSTQMRHARFFRLTR